MINLAIFMSIVMAFFVFAVFLRYLITRTVKGKMRRMYKLGRTCGDIRDAIYMEHGVLYTIPQILKICRRGK